MSHHAPDIRQDPTEEPLFLTTNEAAAILSVTPRWLELKRHQGGAAPPFVRLSRRQIRYERAELIRWARALTHASTAEYPQDEDGLRGTEAVDQR